MWVIPTPNDDLVCMGDFIIAPIIITSCLFYFNKKVIFISNIFNIFIFSERKLWSIWKSVNWLIEYELWYLIAL